MGGPKITRVTHTTVSRTDIPLVLSRLHVSLCFCHLASLSEREQDFQQHTCNRWVGQGEATLPSHGPRRYRAWSERVSPEVCLCAHDHEQKQSPLKGHSAARRMAPRSCVVRTCGGRGVGGKLPRMASASASGTTLMLPEQSISQVAPHEWLSPPTQFLQTRLHSSCEP